MKPLLLISVFALAGSHHLANFDSVPPSIEGEAEYTVSYHENKDALWLRSQFKISDDCTPEECLCVTFDPLPDFRSIGSQSITIVAEDEGLNRSSFSFTLTVYDGKAPEIDGPDYLIYTVYTAPPLEEIVAMYKVKDEIDRVSYRSVLFENYAGHEREAGQYQIILEGQDLSSNVAQKEITVYIKESEPLIWQIRDIVIETTADHFCTRWELLDYMIAHHMIRNAEFIAVEYLYGDYETFYSIVGDHPVLLQLVPKSGEYPIVEVALTIRVTEPCEVQEPSASGTVLDRILQYLTRLWNSICSLFLKDG